MSTSGDSAASDDVWTIRRVLTWSADDLRKRGSTSPRLDAELLLGRVLKMDRIGLLLDADRPLARAELTAYRELHTRRRQGEPVAYLLGVREFYGRPFRVDRRVLIPRPDTEILVEVALERTRHVSLCARVLDLCTGSGCVAISLARERPTTRVLGSDISEGALVVAVENSIRLGAVNCGFVRSDLFAAFRSERFDLITGNPPYIAEPEIPTLAVDIRGYEPHLALTGGPEGLDVVRRIVAEAAAHLTEGGVLALEVGADQGEATRALFAAAGFREIDTRRDYGGHERVVSGIRP
ncbi:Protein-N(5)-glutamine methyltransferase PrmC [Minicystis rosea]|nr:Protein-N(5)-glutamine methyltransferase PrmC [Minicystis rosea]